MREKASSTSLRPRPTGYSVEPSRPAADPLVEPQPTWCRQTLTGGATSTHPVPPSNPRRADRRPFAPLPPSRSPGSQPSTRAIPSAVTSDECRGGGGGGGWGGSGAPLLLLPSRARPPRLSPPPLLPLRCLRRLPAAPTWRRTCGLAAGSTGAAARERLQRETRWTARFLSWRPRCRRGGALPADSRVERTTTRGGWVNACVPAALPFHAPPPALPTQLFLLRSGVCGRARPGVAAAGGQRAVTKIGPIPQPTGFSRDQRTPRSPHRET